MLAAASLPDLSGVVLIPVPMDPRRKRKTGVDHALLLANYLGQAAGRLVLQPLRRRAAPRGIRQAGAGRRDRLIEERIRIESVAPSPRNCLVIDDVHTTGTTLRVVASELARGGAEMVSCMTFARALPPAYAGKDGSSW